MADIKQELEQDVMTLIPLQENYLAMEKVPEVAKYLEAVNAFKNAEALLRTTIQQQMEKNSIKKVAGDWGSMTLYEKTTYKAEDISAVPSKYIKKSLDTTLVGAQVKLSGKLPKGVTKEVNNQLRITLKKKSDEQ